MAKLISQSKYHRSLNGTELVKLREKAGLSQAELAEKCGWSQQFQSQLEMPKEHEVSITVAEALCMILMRRYPR